MQNFGNKKIGNMEFKEFNNIMSAFQDENLSDRVANKVSNMNSLLTEGLSILDPTGTISSVLSLCEKRIGEKEKGRVNKAIFYILKELSKNKLEIEKINHALKDELYQQILQVVDISKKELNEEKIKLYVNILFNNYLNENLSLDIRLTC